MNSAGQVAAHPAESTSNQPSDRRIPSLDGIRAVLVVVVFTAHLLGTRNFPLSRDSIPFEHWAYLAMRVFFIISGFLITGILISEVKRRGTVDLVRFYFKRTFRIFPAYYAFLIVIAIAGWLGAIQLGPGDLLHAFTYTSNYNPDRAWHLGHTWSLSVEEQFYMLWPLALLLAGIRRATLGLVGLMVIIPLWRIVLVALPQGAFGLGLLQAGMEHTFETTADVIAVGCLLALLRPRLWEFAPYRKLIESRAIIGVLLFTIVVPLVPELADRAQGTPRAMLLTLHYAVGLPTVNVAVAVLVDWAMRHPVGSVGRILNHPWAVRVGVMSYSLYLWQQIFLNRRVDHVITMFPLNVILAVTCAWLSFRFVEMPFLELRDRLDSKRRATRVPAETTAATPQPAFAEMQKTSSV